MKAFHYRIEPQDGRDPYLEEDGKTLTVGELIEILNDYPKDMPVLATWEGIYTFFRKGDDYIGTEDWNDEYFKWDEADKETCLIFEVNEH